jgi:uncharacterized protein with HEPN domain
MSKRTPHLSRDDILTALRKIEQYTRGYSFEQFRTDSKAVDAVVRNPEVIGEAARQIPRRFVAEHPEIPWAKMVSLRSTVLHESFGVDVEILWQTICEDFPPLRAQVEKLSQPPTQ